jgi:hypothetical protein
VPIPENPKLIRFGALGPEFATNLDTILDEMGIHYLSISQKWLLRKQDHHFFERRLEDLASGEDRQALKWDHRFVQFWDAKPGLLVSSDGRTKIFYDAAGITVDVNMGENYQELLHNAVREGELLLPKYLSYVDSRTKLEVLGFLIREIDDSIKMGLRPVPVNTIFYACSVRMVLKSNNATIPFCPLGGLNMSSPTASKCGRT